MKIKKIIKRFTGALLSVSLLIGPLSLAAEKTDVDKMQEVYTEELAAKELYSQMIDKFDNDEFYQRIYNAEINHESIMERLINNYGTEAEAGDLSSIDVNDDELQALKDAYEFELADKKDLEERIENTDNADEIRAYEQLKFGSSNHARALEKAIEAYESGNTDLNSLQLNMQNGSRKNAGMGQNNNQGRNNSSSRSSSRNSNNNCNNQCDRNRQANNGGQGTTGRNSQQGPSQNKAKGNMQVNSNQGQGRNNTSRTCTSSGRGNR